MEKYGSGLFAADPRISEMVRYLLEVFLTGIYAVNIWNIWNQLMVT